MPPELPHLLELVEEGVLVLPAAALLHPLLDHPVQDGGDSISAHPLQQVQPAPAGTRTPSGAKEPANRGNLTPLKVPPSLCIPQRRAQLML